MREERVGSVKRNEGRAARESEGKQEKCGKMNERGSRRSEGK